MRRWEYFVAFYSAGHSGGAYSWNFQGAEGLSLDDGLNVLGNAGWELVAVLGHAGAAAEYTFKRPKD